MKKTASRDNAKKSAPASTPASTPAAVAPASAASAPAVSKTPPPTTGVTPSVPPSAQAASPSGAPPAGAPAGPSGLPSARANDGNGRASDPGPGPEETTTKHSATTDAADRIIAASDGAAVLSHAENLTSDKPTTATASARILDDLLQKKPDLLVGAVDRFVSTIASPNKRAVQTSASALPVIAKLAPARVARHLPQLTEAFAEASDVGKDGLVTTFAALCTASVAYQKRLEPVLEVALSTAEAKTLQRWTEIVLPSLKGEPHARARAVVEGRLPALPRPLAQPIATFLGIKLRPLGR